MIYECKVYDKNGKLKKVLKYRDLEKEKLNFLQQKSTIKGLRTITKMRDAKPRQPKQKFYNKFCVVCEKEFHPRHRAAKYCSAECQKAFYKKRKNKKIY